eukprot:1159614-Pelagomonas_calceolata.AAC.8
MVHMLRSASSRTTRCGVEVLLFLAFANAMSPCTLVQGLPIGQMLAFFLACCLPVPGPLKHARAYLLVPTQEPEKPVPVFDAKHSVVLRAWLGIPILSSPCTQR